MRLVVVNVLLGAGGVASKTVR